MCVCVCRCVRRRRKEPCGGRRVECVGRVRVGEGGVRTQTEGGGEACSTKELESVILETAWEGAWSWMSVLLGNCRGGVCGSESGF